ncbi:hypothetical protein BDV96DRAFT_282076 [Lophiotrema nucula]|uniref:Uncharacterized protein n=1 Tax=Lophiotrema nucula TaxID=690887 RepID=A0A6A5ZRS5_9PLEO|nr:hypothetical protein BDV96DRAFT_282076 [Lophiotrema nucula]
MFTKSRIGVTDELRRDMSAEDEKRLWEDLLMAFKMNDKQFIHNCLDLASPGVLLNRQNQLDEYPIHMAARFGDVAILQRVHLPGSSDHLVQRNKLGETPLEVALKANQLDALRWLLPQLKRSAALSNTNQELSSVIISRCFEIAISSERQDLFEILSSWPNWIFLGQNNLTDGTVPSHLDYRRLFFVRASEKNMAPAIRLGLSELSALSPRDRLSILDEAIDGSRSQERLAHLPRLRFVKLFTTAAFGFSTDTASILLIFSNALLATTSLYFSKIHHSNSLACRFSRTCLKAVYQLQHPIGHFSSSILPRIELYRKRVMQARIQKPISCYMARDTGASFC